MSLAVNMDSVQIQHEQAVGDELIAWLNARYHSRSHREREAPDLVYVNGSRQLRVEVVGAYYDSAHAKLLWGAARSLPDNPRSWSGINFDERLIKDIEKQIHKKCALAYGPRCVLLVSVKPPLTTWKEMKELLRSLALPEHVPFDGIYLAGVFPTSPDSQGGYYVWPLKDIAG